MLINLIKSKNKVSWEINAKTPVVLLRISPFISSQLSDKKIDLTLLQTCTNDLINVNTVSKVTKIRNTVKTMD